MAREGVNNVVFGFSSQRAADPARFIYFFFHCFSNLEVKKKIAPAALLWGQMHKSLRNSK
jgi:hypothetical protein